MSWECVLFKRVFSTKFLAFAAVCGAALIGVTLWAWGQPLICTCGYVDFWVGSIFSSGNSQHIADWYTLSHIIHGMLIVLIGRTILPWLGFEFLLSISIVTGVFWEIIEHTDWVLDQFRATTLYQGYLGDSVLNAVADYLWMMGGFLLASVSKRYLILCYIIVLEVAAAIAARDSLTLTTLMLVYPIEAIEDWQQELNPRGPAQQ